MSAEASGFVYRHSPLTGREFSVHAAIGDSVNDQHGNRFWMAVDSLAVKARCGRDTVMRTLDKLEELGGITFIRMSAYGTKEYLFEFPDWPVVFESRDAEPGRRGRPKKDDTSDSNPSHGATGFSENQSTAADAESTPAYAESQQSTQTQGNPSRTEPPSPPSASEEQEPLDPTAPVVLDPFTRARGRNEARAALDRLRGGKARAVAATPDIGTQEATA